MASAARAQAEAEGLTLMPAPGTRSGYKGVTKHADGRTGKPWRAMIGIGDNKRRSLGAFAMPEEAALAVARAERNGQGVPAKGAAMSSQDALAQAEAEGLTLVPAPGTRSGYKGVTKHADGRTGKPWTAQICIGDSKRRSLGAFATPEEAALTVARAEHEMPAKGAAMSSQDALAQAEAEGLTLVPAPGTRSGYKGVGKHADGRTGKPWTASIGIGTNKRRSLGSFATPEEAALAFARASARGTRHDPTDRSLPDAMADDPSDAAVWVESEPSRAGQRERAAR